MYGMHGKVSSVLICDLFALNLLLLFIGCYAEGKRGNFCFFTRVLSLFLSHATSLAVDLVVWLSSCALAPLLFQVLALRWSSCCSSQEKKKTIAVECWRCSCQRSENNSSKVHSSSSTCCEAEDSPPRFIVSFSSFRLAWFSAGLCSHVFLCKYHRSAIALRTLRWGTAPVPVRNI